MLSKEDYVWLQKEFLERLDQSREMTDAELEFLAGQFVLEMGRQRFLGIREKEHLKKFLLHSIKGLDVLQELLEDSSVTEIMVNGPDCIFVERDGKIQRCQASFISRERLEDVIQQIVARVNRVVNDTVPMVNARLEDGSRVHIVLAPIALNGPIVTVRKFSKEAVTMEHLISWNSISREAADFLGALVQAKYNIFISGGTGSGKTTMLNALSHFIPPDERIVTIEDSAELRLNHISNLVQLEARNKNLEGRNEITIRDLIREALRMRPDRIIVGEVRSVETLDMLQAMNTGHDGSLSTGHGNNPADMLKRLETMVLMAADIPLAAVRGQIASAIDVMVHLARFRDGSRKVVKIVEVTGIQDGEIMLESLYDFQEEESKEGTVGGKLLPTGKFLRNREKLENAGTGYIPGISDEG